MNYFNKIWNDNVWSKVIAMLLFTFISYLFMIIFRTFPEFLNLRFNDFSNLNLNIHTTTVTLSALLGILIVALIVLIRKNLNDKNLQKWSGKSSSIKEMEKKFPRLPKISICGIGGVGKTTLIENLCVKKNLNSITLKTEALVLNFSQNSNMHGILLDASGQSQSSQNDIAVKADHIIVMIDHSAMNNSTEISDDRIREHLNFLRLLKDRLKTTKHIPKSFHFLINKKDLWDKCPTKRKKYFKRKIDQGIRKFKIGFENSNVTFSFHSNRNTQDKTELISKIKVNLKK